MKTVLNELLQIEGWEERSMYYLTKEEWEAQFSNVFTVEDSNGKEGNEEFQEYRTVFQELLDTGEQPLLTTYRLV